VIGNDPDFFYEMCLVGWGATKISDFDRGKPPSLRAARAVKL
jgi:hypothetical protein